MNLIEIIRRAGLEANGENGELPFVRSEERRQL